MNPQQLGKRLECLPEALASDHLLRGRGIGNEIAFYIFAYPARYEPVVSDYVPKLVKQLEQKQVIAKHFDLYQLIIEEIKQQGLLEEVFKMEQAKGSAKLETALRRFVHAEKLVALIMSQLTTDHDLILLSGIGAAYPIIRSHTVLNNLHAVVGSRPVIMFFPGAYSGQDLRLFDVLKDDNYYRAFPLLEHLGASS